MRKTNPRALLFDMDGVLVRSEEVWYRLVDEASRRFGKGPVGREEFAPTFGQGTNADVEAFELRCSPAELDAYYQQNFARFGDETWVDPTARGVLVRLRKLGLRKAVVTNTMTSLADEILEQAGLRSLFEFVACADQVPRAKPAPDLLQHALEKLGVDRGEAWMVGDSRYDREAADSAGVRFVGYGIDGDLRVDSLAELVALVGG